MAKKAKSKKSKSKKAIAPDTKSKTLDETVSPSWSTDDVYGLLKAVNEVTLKRMENKIDALTQRVQLLQDQAKAINDRLKSVQEFDIPAIRNGIDSVFNYSNGNLYPNIIAIKAKTDRLP
jgi:hypothetical protein